MSANKKSKYAACGDELKRLRLEQGIATQGELARLLGFTQQTVSRWEAGLSRPRADQVAVLAKVLRADTNALMAIAGHTQEQISVSFDQPLPLASLSPEGFQRFCRSLLEQIYPGSAVHAAGKTGHEQFGIDIEVELTDKKKHTFQCKRVNEFGPAKVKAAVKAHTAKADKKFIMLSGVASPLVRKEIKNHRGWHIWDQDDLSEKLRTLPKEQQRRLVDVYFPGQRFALIGEPSPGPWLTSEDFFSSLLSADRPFNHQWDLVGRASEREKMAEALDDQAKVVVSMVGSAGSGKSRVLRTVIDDLKSRHPKTSVYVLSPTESVTLKSLEDIGSAPKLLVVDDAHDRTDRELLVRYVTNGQNNARLLLVYRPYAEEIISRDLGRYGLVGDHVASVTLSKPTKDDAIKLAQEVLKTLGGPLEAATQIANVAFDSPLSVVVGAWIVAKEGIHPQLFGSSQIFKSAVLQQYKDVLARGITTSTRDQDILNHILRVIALIQPVVPDEPKVLELLQEVEGISASDATRLTKLLVTSGVLFKRGRRYRLSPDLLADSIIETAYITTSGNSNGDAERVFASAIAEHKEHLLINLGRLDWRRNEGDTSDSRLLNSLWSGLVWEDDYRHTQLKAACEAAYYQPRQALQFAERLIEDGHDKEEDVCRLIRNAAYNFRYLPKACELLWEVGKKDDRQQNPHPNHPIRLLTELAQPEPNKPVSYCEEVVNFALSLLPLDDSWTGAYNPFDILKGAMSTEGHFTSQSTSRAITLSAYGVSPEAVAPVRKKIIDATLESLLGNDPKRAFKAAAFISTAVHGPVGQLNRQPTKGERKGWEEEFADTLNRINDILDSHAVSPVILVRIAKSVSWHAHYPEGMTKNPAQRILSRLDGDLVTRVTRILMDGWGHETWKHDLDRLNRNDEIQMEMVAELERVFPSVDELSTFLNDRLLEIRDYCGTSQGSEYFLVNRLLETSIPLTRKVLHARMTSSGAPIADYAAFALAQLLQKAMAEAYQHIDTILETGDDGLAFVARAYSMVSGKQQLSETDKTLLLRIFTSANQNVLASVSWIFRNVMQVDKAFALQLISTGNSALVQGARGDLFMWLGDEEIPLSSIRDEQLGRILSLFEGEEELEHHFVHRFLVRVAARSPRLVIDLAKRRLERSVSEDNWRIYPISMPSRHTGSLKVLDHPEGAALLKEVLDWASDHVNDSQFSYKLGDLVAGVFGVDHESLAPILESWGMGNGVDRFKVISWVLREVGSSFVFEQHAFVERMMKQARKLGKAVYRSLGSSLYASAVSGLRSGTPGKPFPQDVKMKEAADKILQSLSRSDPAYELYDDLRKHAEGEIDRSKMEGIAMDEEDEALLDGGE